MKICPYCAEEIQDDAIYCRWCKHDLSPAEVHPIANRVFKENVEVGTEKKPWGVFWRALLFGAGMGAIIYSYRMSQPMQFPEYGDTGKVNDALLGGLSSIFIYGGVYSFIVWVKRAFIKHDQSIPRLSKETGFISLLCFVMLLVSFGYFVTRPTMKSELPGITSGFVNTDTTKRDRSICYIRGIESNAQIILKGSNVEDDCNKLVNESQGLFYFVNTPIEGLVVCTATDEHRTLIIRDIAATGSMGEYLCRWIKSKQDNSFSFNSIDLTNQYNNYNATPQTNNSEVEDCISWDKVSVADAGKILCVYGPVKNAYYDVNKKGYFILFSSEPSALYLVRYGNVEYGNLINNCVQYTGKVEKIWNTPVIHMGSNEPLYQCGKSPTSSNELQAPTRQASTNPTPISPPTSQPTSQPTVNNPILDITIKVKNQCPDKSVVIFEGPVHLKYDVAPGETKEWQAAKGAYTWTVDGIPGQQSPMELWESVWTLTLCP